MNAKLFPKILSKLLSRQRIGGPVTATEISGLVRDVRLLLLEADVALEVIKDFNGRIQVKISREEILARALTWQEVVDSIILKLSELPGSPVLPVVQAPVIVDTQPVEEIEKKLSGKRFDFNDFLDQLRQMEKLGGFENILRMLPGINDEMVDTLLDHATAFNAEKIMTYKKAIVESMTFQERANPIIINESRCQRIASGCGRSLQEIHQFLNELAKMQSMIGRFRKE